MKPALLELGLALLSGRAGKPWAARAIRARALLAHAIGEARPEIAAKPLEVRPADQRPLLAPIEGPRTGAIEVARSVVESIGTRRFERLPFLLTEDVLVLWPGGALSLHARDDLLLELGRRAGEAKNLEVEAPRSYTLAELRAVLARGIADSFDAALDLHHTLVVTLAVSGGRGPPGRLMLLLEEGHSGAENPWRARSLCLGGPDDAHVASIRAPDPNLPELKIADQIVRRVVLGQGTQLRANAQHLMPKLWVRDHLVAFDELARVLDDGPPRLGSTELVFGETRELPLVELIRIAPRGLAEQIKTRAFEVFGESFDRLAPRIAITQLLELDPSSGEVKPAQTAACLLVRAKEPDGRRRPRVGALFL